MKPTVFIMAAVLAVCAGGCGVQPQPAPSNSFFMLNVQPDAAPIDAASAACLTLRSVTVRPQFAGVALVYRTGELTYEKDYYNQFLAVPDQQFGDILAEWLRSADVRVCADGRTDGTQRLTLEPHLEAIYADFRNPSAPAAYARMRFVLTRYDRSCRCSSIVLDETFEAVAPLPPRPAAEAVVGAMSKAVDEVLAQFYPSLQEAIR